MTSVSVRSAGRGGTRRLVLMAVVAVLLGTVVAANLAEDPGATEDPRASFTFATDNETVLVTHYGGDELDPAQVYVESGVRGRLGNFDGSAGMACAENHTRVSQGTTCRVPNATYERLFVVWEGEENRSLILARRGSDPTPTPTPTPVPTATTTPTTPAANATVTGTPATGTPATGTGTPATETETPATATGTPGTPGTSTGTPGGTTPDGTATPGNRTATPDGGTTTPSDGTATPTETPPAGTPGDE